MVEKALVVVNPFQKAFKLPYCKEKKKNRLLLHSDPRLRGRSEIA